MREFVASRKKETLILIKELGLMKDDVEEAVHQGAHALFFPCGTGHMLGLDVHDMENLGEVYIDYEGKSKSTQFGLKSLRLARKLQPGFVLTVEPGIYFIPQLIDRWRAEKKFTDFINYDRVESYRTFSGIRNEENILITADGHRVLGKPKPKTIEVGWNPSPAHKASFTHPAPFDAKEIIILIKSK